MEIEQSGPIIAHCCRNHGMRPIISRYFIPIKRVEMIEMHFGTQHSLWEPPRIQDGRQNRNLDTSFELLLFVYNATTYDISLSGWFYQGLFTSHLVNVKTFAKAKSSWSNTTSLLLSGCYDERIERMN